MRHWRCWFREHDYELVSPKWPLVIPDVGLVMKYEPDEKGEYLACRRCRHIVGRIEARRIGGPLVEDGE